MSAHVGPTLSKLNSDFSNSYSDLMNAARIGHLEYMQEPGAAEYLRHLTPGEQADLLLTAISHNQHDVVDWLLSGCCGDHAVMRWVNAERVPCLVLACQNHMYSVAERLIEAGVDVNMRAGEGVHATALHMLLRCFHNIVQPGHAPRDRHRHAFSAIYSAVLRLSTLMADTGTLHIDIADGRGRTVEHIIAQPGYLGALASPAVEERLRRLLTGTCLPPRLSCLAARASARDFPRACLLLPPRLLHSVVLHLLPQDVAPSRPNTGVRHAAVGRGSGVGTGAEVLRQAGRALRNVFLPRRKKSSSSYKSHD